MNRLFNISVAGFLVLLLTNCMEKKSDKNELNAIFPKGKLGSAEMFTGKAWNTGLVDKPKHQSIDQALVDICKLKFGSSLCE